MNAVTLANVRSTAVEPTVTLERHNVDHAPSSRSSLTVAGRFIMFALLVGATPLLGLLALLINRGQP